MGKDSAYYNSVKNKRETEIKRIKSEMPQYARGFIDECLLQYQMNTTYCYARDLALFFKYIKSSNPMCRDLEMASIPLEVIAQLGPQDINEFQVFVAEGHKPNKNGDVKASKERSVSRRMASVRNFFKYLIKYDYITVDPTLKAVSKKKDSSDKGINRLNAGQVKELIHSVSNVTSASYHSQVLSERTARRDFAIVTLFLNTGIRVSECAGLDLSDVNFADKTIEIVRKGGKGDFLILSNPVEQALKEYVELERDTLLAGQEDPALFISLKHRRLSVRSIQHMIEKYGENTGLSDKLTPHKLRRTYGTALYNKTGDIYMVADVLGYKDINTTVKHYAAIDEEHKQKAAQIDVYETDGQTSLDS